MASGGVDDADDVDDDDEDFLPGVIRKISPQSPLALRRVVSAGLMTRYKSIRLEYKTHDQVKESLYSKSLFSD